VHFWSVATTLTKRAIRIRRKIDGRRVGTTLTIDTYVAFKAYVARQGMTGEQVIVAAIERLLRDA
jgi:uncharacterized phage protein gp47/JayE